MAKPRRKNSDRGGPLMLGTLICAVGLAAYYFGGGSFGGSSTTSAASKRAAALSGNTGSQFLLDLYLQTIEKSVMGGLIDTSNGADINLEAAQKYNVHWAPFAISMVGFKNLENIRQLVEDVIENDIPGDFVECGVWRGGASLFAKAVLRAHGADANRAVHVVDSFAGLPKNTTAMDGAIWSEMDFLQVSLDQVRGSFQRYGLLDDQVEFHKGFFRYSLPVWREHDNRAIAVLRMDGDMYESTMDQLYNLYNAVSPGGYVIIDDYAIPECKAAVHEFLDRHGIKVNIIVIDHNNKGSSPAYFKKPAGAAVDISWYTQFNTSRSSDDLVGATNTKA